MRISSLNKYRSQIFLAIGGVFFIAVSFFADAIGWGSQAGFGSEQMFMAMLGFGMVLATGVMLFAQRFGWWELHTPSAPELGAQIRRHWSDIFLVVALASIAGFVSYQGAQRIPPAVFGCDYESNIVFSLYHSDIFLDQIRGRSFYSC
jgi:hypothetical protein